MLNCDEGATAFVPPLELPLHYAHRHAATCPAQLRLQNQRALGNGRAVELRALPCIYTFISIDVRHSLFSGPESPLPASAVYTDEPTQNLKSTDYSPLLSSAGVSRPHETAAVAAGPGRASRMLKSIRQRCDAGAVKGMRECLYVARRTNCLVCCNGNGNPVCRQLPVVCCRRRPLSRKRRRTSAAFDRRSPTRPSARRPLFGTPPRTARLP